jgi:hypothetical protein
MTSYDGLTLPTHTSLPANDQRTDLYNGLRDAIEAIPLYFKSPIIIEGLSATDLFSMNTLLGSAIEEQTVSILNSLRSVWDKDARWGDREFRRYPESFPDVRLVKNNADTDPLIGIELKGWYLLSKEQDPSFRFKACVDAMTPWDIIVCVPWGLSNVLSGKPIAYEPYIEQGIFAANMRTYYWNHRRSDSSSANRNCTIQHPSTNPYPIPGSKYIDVPEQDGGGNFGRLGRIEGLMDEWRVQALDTPMAGIQAKYWIRFFSLFKESASEPDIEKQFELISEKIRQNRNCSPSDADNLLDHIRAIINLSGLA